MEVNTVNNMKGNLKTTHFVAESFPIDMYIP